MTASTRESNIGAALNNISGSFVPGAISQFEVCGHAFPFVVACHNKGLGAHHQDQRSCGCHNYSLGSLTTQ